MKVGIIGAGEMGVGIAQVFAQAKGYEVCLCDCSQELAQQGKERMAQSLQKHVMRGMLKQEVAEEILSKIHTGVQKICADCDLIVEAITENMQAKRQLFLDLETICKKECMFTTNTSTLSITEMGAGLCHPFAGLHFFYPVPMMKLVEVIAGLQTPQTLLTGIRKISIDIGKTPVQIRENAGFVVNRILLPMINEAIGLYAEGIATVEEIDTAMKLGANHPVGPLALGDGLGLDHCLALLESLEKETGDPKYRPHPYLRKMVRGERLGMKNGRGFYNYRTEERGRV